MDVITPSVLTLTATDVAASALDEWAVGTAYTTGQQVKVTTAAPHHEYEALQGSTGKVPASEPDYWLDLGATNQYRLLDDTVDTVTTATTSMEMTLTPAGRVTHLCLFGLDGVRTVRVRITAEGSLQSDTTYAISNVAGSTTWWEYFFGSQEWQEALVQAINGAWLEQAITVTLTGDTSATISCGHLVLGVGSYLGETEYGATVGLISYSRKETDEWGNAVLVPRANAKTASVRLRMDDSTLDRVRLILERLDAIACVWELNNGGTEYDSFRMFGFFKDFRILLQGYNDTYCDLEIEGLI